MTDTNTWLITGAARGMGIDLAQAALSAGHSVVATARNAAKVTQALGEQGVSEELCKRGRKDKPCP